MGPHFPYEIIDQSDGTVLSDKYNPFLMIIYGGGPPYVGHRMWVTVCGSPYVSHRMWVTVCGSPYVGHRMWVTVCGSPYVGHRMWVTVCGSPYVGHRMWVTVCGSPYVGHRMWVTVDNTGDCVDKTELMCFLQIIYCTGRRQTNITTKASYRTVCNVLYCWLILSNPAPGPNSTSTDAVSLPNMGSYIPYG